MCDNYIGKTLRQLHYGYTYTLHIYTYIYIYIGYKVIFVASSALVNILRAKGREKELFPSRKYVAYRVSRNYYHFFLVTRFLIVIFVIKARGKILLKRSFKIGFVNFFYMRSLLCEIIRSTFNCAYSLIVATILK